MRWRIGRPAIQRAVQSRLALNVLGRTSIVAAFDEVLSRQRPARTRCCTLRPLEALAAAEPRCEL